MTSWLQCSLCETVLAGKVFAIPTLRGQRVPTTINKRNYKKVKKICLTEQQPPFSDHYMYF